MQERDHILAVETATSVCSVALSDGERLLGEKTIAGEKNVHAERLFDLIRELLETSQLEPRQLAAVAVSIGPGSFTGLRIGLSAAKGIVLAVGAKLIAVPTLDALARRAPRAAGTICTLINSRKGESYCALYTRHQDRIAALSEPRLLRNDALLDYVPDDAAVIGPGIGRLDAGLLGELSTAAKVHSATDPLPSAVSVAEIAGEYLRDGAVCDPVTVEPHYLQDFIAKRPVSGG